MKNFPVIITMILNYTASAAVYTECEQENCGLVFFNKISSTISA